MSEQTIAELEQTILELPFEEQRRLIERVTGKLQQDRVDEMDFQSQLAEMARDENIQAELRRIERDFALSEFDGLSE
jgi:phage gp16-like protein